MTKPSLPSTPIPGTPNRATPRDALSALDPRSQNYAVDFVETVLRAGREAHASDLHFQPTADGLELRWRMDGVLALIGRFPSETAPNIIARLKVLADLLTYRTDLPQEGRIRNPSGPARAIAAEDRVSPSEIEMRVSTFPTLFGEKAVVRVFAGKGHYQRLDDLGLPGEVAATLRRLLAETSGAIIVTGPAGSGKTTTVYACLRELAEQSAGARNIVSLEDPIEVAVAGVTQSQVNPPAGFDLERGLRSLMRQDPEVIMVGEIRDPATAGLALQASLTGHLVLTTFHAGSAAGAVSRLSDMGIEPYLLRSVLQAVVCQRLLRRLCASCTRQGCDPGERLGLPVSSWRMPVGCPACGGSGYQGRLVLAEMLIPERSELGRAILSRTDTGQLERLAVAAGMVTRWQRACQAIEAGLTSPGEVRRVFGFSQEDTLPPEDPREVSK